MGHRKPLEKPQIVQLRGGQPAVAALDRLDRRILALLQSTGRISNQSLAAQIGLSASACLARVKRLETTGVIMGYLARVAPARLGPGLIVFAEITLKQHQPADMARFEAAVLALPEVIEASQVSGAFDYLLKLVLPDMPTWVSLADDLMAGELCIDKIATHVLMKETKRFTGYPV